MLVIPGLHLCGEEPATRSAASSSPTDMRIISARSGRICSKNSCTDIPVYAARLTLGADRGQAQGARPCWAGRSSSNSTPGDVISSWAASDVELIAVNHSHPRCLCAGDLDTKAGLIVQTGDFKVDFTPVAGPVIDLARFGRAGTAGCSGAAGRLHQRRAPRCRSKSERVVGDTFESPVQAGWRTAGSSSRPSPPTSTVSSRSWISPRQARTQGGGFGTQHGQRGYERADRDSAT